MIWRRVLDDSFVSGCQYRTFGTEFVWLTCVRCPAESMKCLQYVLSLFECVSLCDRRSGAACSYCGLCIKKLLKPYWDHSFDRSVQWTVKRSVSRFLGFISCALWCGRRDMESSSRRCAILSRDILYITFCIYVGTRRWKYLPRPVPLRSVRCSKNAFGD